jgi:integrase
MRRAWHAARERAGVRPINVYNGTKHTTATALRELGYPLDLIQHAAGHADPASTERYANVADRLIAEAMRKVRA